MAITVKASEFKATCLALLDEVEATHEPVIVTKRGRPVAKLVPIDGPKSLVGSVTFVDEDDDLLSTGETWEADA